MLIVTASDKTHWYSQCQLLDCLKNEQVSVWDLGWLGWQREKIKERYAVSFTEFPYYCYPLWMDIDKADGEYAWKAQVVRAEARFTSGVLIWSDAGNIITDLTGIMQSVTDHGMYMGGTRGTIAEWTDPRTLRRLKVTPEQARHPMRAASLIGFDLQRPWVRQLIEDWADASLVKDIIAPEGTNKRNRPPSEGGTGGHRQDQSVIDCLLAKHEADKHMTYDRPGWKIHCDCDRGKKNV